MESMELKKNNLIAKIVDLKFKLRDSDYQAIKFAEGELSAAEYAPTKVQRQAWRNEINRLEAELANT